MTKQQKTYENYPWWIMVVSNAVTFMIYGIGMYIIAQLGIIPAALYLLYIIMLYVRLLTGSCSHCCYYGKCCAFGYGKISALLFKRKDAESFADKKLTWKDLIPDLLVSLIPLIAGIILLLKNFSWLIVLLLALIVVLTTVGNSFVRGTLACRFCRQREIGCPAEKLFNKKK